MKNCEKCIHYEVCLTWAEGFEFDTQEICQHFSEQVNLIEVPIKPHEIVYLIHNKQITVCTVEGIYFTTRGNYIRLRPIIQSYNGNQSTYYKVPLKNIKQKVFYSEPDAQKYLEQLKRK